MVEKQKIRQKLQEVFNDAYKDLPDLKTLHEKAEKIIPYCIGGDTDSVDVFLWPVTAKLYDLDEELVLEQVANFNMACYKNDSESKEQLLKFLSEISDLQDQLAENLLEILHEKLDDFLYSRFNTRQSTIRFSADPPAETQLILAKKMYVLNTKGELTFKNIGVKRTDPEYTRNLLPKLAYLIMSQLIAYESEHAFQKDLLYHLVPIIRDIKQKAETFDESIGIPTTISDLGSYKTLTQAVKAFVAYEAIRLLSQKVLPDIELEAIEIGERYPLFLTAPYIRPKKLLAKFSSDVQLDVLAAAIVAVFAKHLENSQKNEQLQIYRQSGVTYCCGYPISPKTALRQLNTILAQFKARSLKTAREILDVFFKQIILPNNDSLTLEIVTEFVQPDYTAILERVLFNYVKMLTNISYPVEFIAKSELPSDSYKFDVWFSRLNALTRRT